MKRLNILLLCLCLLTIGQSMSLAQNNHLGIEIVGHRGASFLAPENTLAAAKLAWELGADGVEIDIHMTADKEIVVIHDKSTFRTCGKRHQIADVNYSAIKDLDAGSFKSPEFAGEPIPLLEDILDALPNGRTLYIEIKASIEILPVLEKQIKNHHKNEQFRIIAFDFETIAEAKERFPDIPCYHLKSIVLKSNYNKYIDSLKEHKLDGADLRSATITPELVKGLAEAGMLCLAWTVDSTKELMKWGVVGITTNRPGYLIDNLK